MLRCPADRIDRANHISDIYLYNGDLVGPEMFADMQGIGTQPVDTGKHRLDGEQLMVRARSLSPSLCTSWQVHKFSTVEIRGVVERA